MNADTERESIVCRAITDWQTRKFSFAGDSDCCQFAGDVVARITGSNPMQAFLYTDEREAAAIIGSYGSLVDAIRATLGEPSPPPHRAGDVAVFDQVDGSQIAGIILGDVAIVRTRRSVVDWPSSAAVAVWSV